jgi:hypothetical protein
MRSPCLILLAAVLVACAPAQPGGGSPSDSSVAPTAAPSVPTLGGGELSLDPGNYRIDLTGLNGGAEYPPFEITVPDGWVSMDGWALARPGDQASPSVAITFWNVDEVFGHPCQWVGTERQPEADVDSLAAALLDVPLRSATEPRPVSLDGREGLYLEWRVPDDIEMEEDGDFPDCDETTDGHRDFRSWTGSGWASVRYHQGPGQLDRLWILDVDGQRLVIDAFSMPWATDAEITELEAMIESIDFEEG